MSSDEVQIARADSVLTVTVNRPADQNRLTRDVLVTLQDLVDDLRNDDTMQAVVITGAGVEFFSMGILNPAVRT